jgi:preprotein translocase SecE subunit
MKKYIVALKNVTWPEGNEVTSNLGIVIFGIISFTLFFIVTDTLISKFLEVLYS